MHRLSLLLAASLVLSACSRPAPPAKAAGPRSTPVTTVTVSNISWDRTLSVVGTLVPFEEATLGAQVEGTVEEILVDFGARVTAGQELARIDTRSYEAQVESAAGNAARAQATRENAKKSFDRVSELKQKGVSSESDFDTARAQLDQAEAEIRAAGGAERVARLNLERSHVRAPFAGGITERLASRGDFLKVGEPIFRLVDDASLKFTFQVPERFGSKVSPGLDVALSVDNFPGETFRGSVQLISPAVNTVSRAFDVAARVENPALRLKANSFARGSLVLERGVNVPVIPLESVITFAGVTKVFVLENGTARARTVVTGRIRDGMQEIISGVAAGDAVITSGQSRLGDGAAVTLRSPAPAKP